ncbi:MAG: hypothetical protein GC159_06260 [Phycisphaera sp.]|nr:hypothetical protein [Phycisphaera sp.]
MTARGSDNPTRDRVAELASRAADDALNDREMAELNAILDTDDDARAYYVACIHTHTALRMALSRTDQTIALERHAQIFPARAPRPYLRYAAAAALLLFASVTAALMWQAPRHTTAPPVARPVTVATIVNTDSARWADDAAGILVPGAEIEAGPLRLESGVAQLVMRSGAVVDLIGKTTVQITGPNSGRLESGRLFAHVPPQAVGFTVTTPHTTVTDLGTEFGVDVDTARADTQVHVFKGRVQMVAPRIDQTLDAGHATAINDAGDASVITPDPFLFMPGPAYAADVLRSRPIGYWRFDETRDDVVANLADPDRPAKIVGQSQLLRGPELEDANPIGAEETNRALRLTGHGYVDTGDIGNFERTDAFSMGAWVRVTHGLQQNLMGRMDANANYRGYDLQMIQNGDLYFQLISQYAAGLGCIEVQLPQPLPAGAWRHVLVTYDGSGKAAGVRMYLDGEPQDVIIRRDNLRDTTRVNLPFTIGRRSSSGPRGFMGPLNGNIDEVVLYDRALTPEEARTLATLKP